MKKSSRRRPEVESLESLKLLSTILPGARPSLALSFHTSEIARTTTTPNVRTVINESTTIPSYVTTPTSRHVTVIGTETRLTTALGKGGTVHAMIIAADSIPVVSGGESRGVKII